MCPRDDSYHTFEYDDHFVIAPSISFSSRSNDFTRNAIDELGKAVEPGFEYNSNDNPDFMTVEEIKKFNSEACK
jgi:UDP-N-acetylglucosamine 4,6-dehydratase